MTQNHTPSSNGQMAGSVARSKDIPIVFEFGGHLLTLRDLQERSELERELTALLRNAGYAGTFKLTAQGKELGRPHTQGLRILAPEKHGVGITWHRGGNDSRIKLLLSLPHATDAYAFHRKLKAAAELVEENDSVEQRPTPLSPLQIQEDHTGKGTVVSLNLPHRPTQQHMSAESLERFVDDPLIVGVFMSQIYNLRKARNDGREVVSRKACDTVLTEACDVSDPGGAMQDLLDAGYLLATEEPDVFAIGTRWSAQQRAMSEAQLTVSQQPPSEPPEKTSPQQIPNAEIPSAPDDFDRAAQRSGWKTGLTKSDETMIAFIRECGNLASRGGLIRRFVCAEAAKRMHGYDNVGPVMASLVKRGFLEIVEEDDRWYRIPERFRLSQAKTALESAPAAAPPHATAKSSNGDEDFAARLTNLKKKAESAGNLRKQLTVVESEIANLEELLKNARARKAKIEQVLSSPGMRKVEDTLAQVRSLLEQ